MIKMQLLLKFTFQFLGSSDNFYENLNISFEKHKHHIITGDNGSGKSTFALLTGALKPYKGEGYILSNKIGYIGATPLILDDTLRKICFTHVMIKSLTKNF